MLYRLLNFVADSMAGKPTAARSPQWPAVERQYLKEHPRCEVCGGTIGLNVHHKRPYHLFPSLELDPDNLITLCRPNDCHFLFGHGRDWKAFNLNVDSDVAHARKMIEDRRYVA